ncbi:Peptidase A1 domain-containing protein [Aphelenchoides besseyi]|nr:Peptidase A1 domain-containing protein [Aphelenchoides besseyi]
MTFRIVIFPVQVGSPPQQMYVTHSLMTSQTVFVDVECGQQPSCPLYCKDRYFKRMYCTPICEVEITQTICNQGQETPLDPIYANGIFWSQNSSTFRLSNKNDWYSNTGYFRKQSGKYFTDTLTFLSDGNLTANLTIQSAEMVDGLLLDITFPLWSGGVIGLGPGDRNIVSQLHAQNLIPLPTAYLYARRDQPIGILGFGMNVRKIGICENKWIEYQTKDPNFWVLELEDFELNGFSYGKKTKALLTDVGQRILLPAKFVHRLIELNVLGVYDGPKVLNYVCTFPCDKQMELNFTINGRNLTLSTSDLMWKLIDNNTCASNLAPMVHPHYLTDVDVSLGRSFLSDFCISLDYEQMKVSFAKHKKRSADD